MHNWIIPTTVIYIATLICACHNVDTIQASYSDYSEAKSKGAIEREWLPSFLPASATNITECHSIDSNEVLVHFNAKGGDIFDISSSCIRIDYNSVAFPSQHILSQTNWWPTALQSNSESGADYIYYICHHTPNGGILSNNMQTLLAVKKNATA